MYANVLKPLKNGSINIIRLCLVMIWCCYYNFLQFFVCFKSSKNTLLSEDYSVLKDLS